MTFDINILALSPLYRETRALEIILLHTLIRIKMNNCFTQANFNPYDAEIFLYNAIIDQRIFQFEISIIGLVN